MKLIRIYYLLTPLFLVIEIVFNNSIRVEIPGGNQNLNYVYLLACFIFGGFVFRKPPASSLFALLETSLNLFLLILSVMLPLIKAPETIASGKEFSFGLIDIIHFFIAASVLIVCFNNNPLILGKTKNA